MIYIGIFISNSDMDDILLKPPYHNVNIVSYSPDKHTPTNIHYTIKHTVIDYNHTLK